VHRHHLDRVDQLSWRRLGVAAGRVEDADEPVAQRRRRGQLLLHPCQARAHGGLQLAAFALEHRRDLLERPRQRP
jgi:hypothetical protein